MIGTFKGFIKYICFKDFLHNMGSFTKENKLFTIFLQTG